MNNDLISRQAAIDAIHGAIFDFFDICDDDEESPMTYKDEQLLEINKAISGRIKQLPSAQPEQRYTEEELRVFQHGISLSLLSKRSSQHWQYDEDTATEIKFLERLYEKVVADMRGEQDG